jgi:crotonobetainyl-CoA:carnitine CoA-transferase CaiB-like acyl-CoA transferase
MERLNLGYDALAALNPRLIYGSLTAYGTRGPYADKAGFDRIVQGLSGALHRRDSEGRAMGAGTLIADWSAPMLMAYGISLALLVREKTGVGQRVESSLLQAAIAMQLGDLAVMEDDPDPPREENPPAYGGYVCADGAVINVTALFPEQWRRFCHVLDLPDLADDPRLTDPKRRDQLREEAGPLIHAILATRPAQEWLDVLMKADVPCGPIVDRPRVAYEEQVVANEMIVPVDHPVVGRTRIMGVPVRLSKTPSVPLSAAPLLGEHTDAILNELGYSPERIATLREAGVI